MASDRRADFGWDIRLVGRDPCRRERDRGPGHLSHCQHSAQRRHPAAEAACRMIAAAQVTMRVKFWVMAPELLVAVMAME